MIEIVPIGFVESSYSDPSKLTIACKKGTAFDDDSAIVINEELKPMLRGLEEFSHAWVLFHLHKAERVEPVTHPGTPDMKDLPKVGVLASRSQYRQNHIALRLVKIKKIEGRTIRVNGLDAISGSPVIDIKPYVPHFDLPENPRVAEWYKDWKS